MLKNTNLSSAESQRGAGHRQIKIKVLYSALLPEIKHAPTLLVRNIFIHRLYPNRLRRHHIFKGFDSNELKGIRMSYLSFPLLPKVKASI